MKIIENNKKVANIIFTTDTNEKLLERIQTFKNINRTKLKNEIKNIFEKQINIIAENTSTFLIDKLNNNISKNDFVFITEKEIEDLANKIFNVVDINKKILTPDIYGNNQYIFEFLKDTSKKVVIINIALIETSEDLLNSSENFIKPTLNISIYKSLNIQNNILKLEERIIENLKTIFIEICKEETMKMLTRKLLKMSNTGKADFKNKKVHYIFEMLMETVNIDDFDKDLNSNMNYFTFYSFFESFLNEKEKVRIYTHESFYVLLKNFRKKIVTDINNFLLKGINFINIKNRDKFKNGVIEEIIKNLIILIGKETYLKIFKNDCVLNEQNIKKFSTKEFYILKLRFIALLDAVEQVKRDWKKELNIYYCLSIFFALFFIYENSFAALAFIHWPLYIIFRCYVVYSIVNRLYKCIKLYKENNGNYNFELETLSRKHIYVICYYLICLFSLFYIVFGISGLDINRPGITFIVLKLIKIIIYNFNMPLNLIDIRYNILLIFSCNLILLFLTVFNLNSYSRVFNILIFIYIIYRFIYTASYIDIKKTKNYVYAFFAIIILFHLAKCEVVCNLILYIYGKIQNFIINDNNKLIKDLIG